MCGGCFQNKVGLLFIACVRCGLKIRHHNDGVDRLYRSGWLAPLENLNLTGGTTPELAKNYSSELTRTLRLRNLRGLRILDFGGGRGEMARALVSDGAKVVVVDPYSHLQLRDTGLAAVESLEHLEGLERFHGAVAIDVIEHLTTPWEQLQTIRNLLAVGGWLYISTPNAGGLNARITRENWREAHNPSHLLLFTSSSMEKLLQKAGFNNYRRLRWRVNYSEKKSIRFKDWLLRSFWLDGVLRYLADV
jgi:cyclopropane fatty-acyl-phospholipid synthase-like methyltransferase